MKPLLKSLLLTMSCFAGGATHAATASPNIVYILADDMGFGDVHILNPEQGKIPTPHMDQLGREGMIFTDAHSNSAVCTPTRYGVLTGRYAWRSRLKRSVLSGYSEHLIEPGRETLASLLKKNGYSTGYIGKWHMGWDWPVTGPAVGKGINRSIPIDYTMPIKNGPKENGFEYSYGFCGSLDMPPYVYVENGMPTAVPEKDSVRTAKVAKNGWWRKGPTAPDFDHWDVLPNLTRRAVQFVEEKAQSDQPFFLYLPLPSPHTPVLPTEAFVGKSGLDSLYADFVLMTDDAIGQVMQAVKDAGIEQNTIIIVTSDNGCSPQADFEELLLLGHNPSYIYRGAKADIFEGGHRVPFIVRWPNAVKAGSICEDTTCLTDMMATCADILGVKLAPDSGEDSVSMLPNLLGTATNPLREATVHHSIDGTFAIRKGKFKLVDAPHSGGWSAPKRPNEDLPPIQLYDLESDPSEKNNLYDQYPEVVQQLKALLKKYKQEGRSV